MATAAEMASGSYFKAVMVRCISKAVSCSRIGLYCGEMGSQPKLKVDPPVTGQNCFYNLGKSYTRLHDLRALPCTERNNL